MTIHFQVTYQITNMAQGKNTLWESFTELTYYKDYRHRTVPLDVPFFFSCCTLNLLFGCHPLSPSFIILASSKVRLGNTADHILWGKIWDKGKLPKASQQKLGSYFTVFSFPLPNFAQLDKTWLDFWKPDLHWLLTLKIKTHPADKKLVRSLAANQIF